MPHDAFSPAQTAEACVAGAIAKTKINQGVIFLKAFNAGIFLSMGASIITLVGGGSEGLTASNPGLVKLIQAAFSLPFGLMLIVLNGQELVTGNMMTIPLAALAGKIKWYWVPFNIMLVFMGNLVGALFYDALLVKYSHIQAEAYAEFAITFARAKAVEPLWWEIFLRGIGCNILVCLAVWQATAARETASKVLAIWFPVFLFVALGFDHVVANMYFIPVAIMYESPDISTGYYIWKSMIPAFLGNQIGGLILAVPFWLFYLTPLGSVDATTAPNPNDIEAGHRGLRDGTTGGSAGGFINDNKETHGGVVVGVQNANGYSNGNGALHGQDNVHLDGHQGKDM